MGLTPIHLRQSIAASLIASIIALAGLISQIAQKGVLFPFTWTADYTRLHYGIIVDAGSHGTRAHIYEWNGRVEDPSKPLISPLTIPREVFTYDPGLPGLSSFIHNATYAGPIVIQPLVDKAKEWFLHEANLTEDAISKSPIYLKATAGMRSMGVDERDAIMNSVRATFRDSPFVFEDDWARTIPGEQEGVFGWLAVNNHLQSILSPASLTTGALDLGGASSQITFMPQQASVLEDYYETELGGQMIRLYSHSFLGYGWGDALMRITTRLALEFYFRSLVAELHRVGIMNDTDIDLSGLFNRNDLVYFEIVKDPELTDKQIKRALLLGNKENKKSSDKYLILKAYHPCFPTDFHTYFDIPSMLYPDGRFFLDIDVRGLLTYLESIGIDINHPIIQSHFPPEIIAATKQHPIRFTKTQSVMEQIMRDPREYAATLQTFRKKNSHKRHKKRKLNQIDSTFDDIVPFQSFMSLYGNDVNLLNAETSVPFHPFTSPLPESIYSVRVIFQGSGNFDQCHAMAKELFYQEPCFLSTCAFNGVYLPRIAESKFLALGQYAKVRAALGVTTRASPNTIAKRAAEVCGTSWTQVRLMHSNGQFKPFGKHSVASLCWKSIWVYSTLVDGYGFDGDSQAVTFFDLLTSPEEQQEEEDSAVSSDILPTVSASPSWALGAMIIEISGMPWDSTLGRFEGPFWWAFISAIFLGILATLQYIKVRYLRSKIHLSSQRSDCYLDYPHSPVEENQPTDHAEALRAPFVA